MELRIFVNIVNISTTIRDFKRLSMPVKAYLIMKILKDKTEHTMTLQINPKATSIFVSDILQSFGLSSVEGSSIFGISIFNFFRAFFTHC